MAKYKEEEKQAARMIRNAKRNFDKNAARENNSNNRPFFAYIKGRMKCRALVRPLKDKQQRTVAGYEMVNLLKDYFFFCNCLHR
jgi:hypothetical protein